MGISIILLIILVVIIFLIKSKLKRYLRKKDLYVQTNESLEKLNKNQERKEVQKNKSIERR